MSYASATDDDGNRVNVNSFWKEGRGLKYWDCTSASDRTPTTEQLRDVDVVMVSSAAFKQSDEPWFLKHEWTTVIADEGHVYLRGQHNSNTISHTLRHWYSLQHRTISCFVLSGTPFVTKVSFDAVRMIQAVASDRVRGRWGKEYATEELSKLFDRWRSTVEDASEVQKEQRAAQGAQYAAVLSGCTLKRDQFSKIRGKPVIRDYIKECAKFVDPLPSNPAEVILREQAYRKIRPQGTTASDRHGILRCLAYTLKFEEWWIIDHCAGSAAQKRTFWGKWTLEVLIEETKLHARLKKVCSLLSEAKSQGEGVVIFAQRVFLAELFIKVHLFLVSHSRHRFHS
jgi:hypothetical protein